MKIAIICPAFLPATQFGGILFLALDIAKELTKKKCDVTVYTTDLDFTSNSMFFNKKLPQKENMYGFTVQRSHVDFHIGLFFVNLGFYKQIIKNKPQLIHSIGIRSFQSFISAIISKLHNMPLVISDQGGLFTHPDFQNKGTKRILYKIQEPIIKFIINQSRKIMVANEYEYSIFTKYCKPEKLELISNGIDINSLKKPQLDFKKQNKLKGRMILFLGRFAKVKGIDVLLKAFYELTKESRFDDVTLVIMGADFGYSQEMFKIIKKLRLTDKILVIQKPERNQVIAAYHACNFLVLPSRWEMSPLTPLEGFACNKPTIGSSAHGIPYVVRNEENGLIFENENSYELKEKMAVLLTDSEKCRKLGQRGYKMIQDNWNHEMMGKKVLEMYEEILNKNIKEPGNFS